MAVDMHDLAFNDYWERINREPCASCDGRGCPACRPDGSFEEHERRAGRLPPEDWQAVGPDECPGCCAQIYWGTDDRYRNEDGSLHTCHLVTNREEDQRIFPPVALIAYRCPVQGRQLTVGPADYQIFVWPTVGPVGREIAYMEATVSVNCICGTPHRLNLFDSES